MPASASPATASELNAPLAARLVAFVARPGEVVAAGAPLVVLEAMKMEHELVAPTACRVLDWLADVDEMVHEAQPLLRLQPLADAAPADWAQTATARDDQPRADLRALADRLAWTADAARPDAVARRHAAGRLTAREIVAALCDPGSFSEVGALAVAAQRTRRSDDDLMRHTPADGLVCGTARVGGIPAVVLVYDATVLAGTQGMRNHQKTDRLLQLAARRRLPVLLWAEGGGGRPGDVDMPVVAGLHVPTFAAFAALSGRVPLIGMVGGRCFAGNAALLGCCDVIVATRGANIGMGGPAMVEGGGLGTFTPEQIGPATEQWANGVIDLLVDDDAAVVGAGRRALALLCGSREAAWQAGDATALRDAVPEQRQRAYDVRRLMAQLFDTGSVLELRAGHGQAVSTALARLEGRPLGVLASNPQHLGGAIDADAADKAARFMALCSAHGLPLVSLVDTPGFMVGPQSERQAQVRRASRMFIEGARLAVPLVAVVLRKAYGLGAMAMTAGGFQACDAICAWPSGEFGAMGLEGAVRLGWRKELEAVPEGAEREALFQRLLAAQRAAGSAIPMAATLEIDAVIDPAHTRPWLVNALAAASASGQGV